MYQAGRKAPLEGGVAGDDPPPSLRRNVVYLGITSLITDVSSEMVASVLPLYLVFHLKQTPLGYGAIDGLRQGATAFLALGSGFLTDRSRKHKQIAAVGYALSAICNLGLLLVGGVLSALAGITLLDRLGKGMRVVPRDALISLSTPRASLGRAFGLHRALDTTGSMLGPIAAFALLAFLPDAFDVVFVMSFFVALIGLGVLVAFVENPRDPEGETGRPRVSLAGALGLLSGARFRTTLVVGAVLGAMTISDGFVYLVMQKRIHFEAHYLPLLYVATPLVYMLLALPFGRLADRVGRGRVYVFGYALLLLLYACALLPGFGLPQLALVVVLLGAYYAATDGVLMALVSALLPSELRASGLALITTTTNLGRFAASLLFGWLWSAYDTRIAVVVFAAGLLVALAGATIALARVQPPSNVRAEP